MRSLIAIMGTCLTAAAAACQAAEPGQGTPKGPDSNPAEAQFAAAPGAPAWWSNATAADTIAGVAKYGSAVADDTQVKTGTGTTTNSGFNRSTARAVVEPVPVFIRPDKPAVLSAAASDVLRPLPENLPAAAPDPPRPIKLAAAHASSAAAATALRPAASPATSAAAPSLTLGSHGDQGAQGNASPLHAAFTVGGCLSIVLGLFLVIAWAMRKTAPRGSLVLPKEVFDILGRAPLGARQQVQLLRCGNKLLLVSITPQGTETLTEVTDPLEVDRIAGICQQGNPKSSTAAFRQVFQQVASASGKPPVDDEFQASGPRRKRYRWEEKHA